MKKLCSYPNCRNITTDGVHRCIKHRKTTRSNEVIQRAKFYNTNHWKKFSKYIRQQNPICEICNKELTSDLDHWLEVSLDKEQLYTFDRRNMVCMCKACHLRKGSKLQRLIRNNEYHKIYQILLVEHPRKSDVSYLHDWIEARIEEEKAN
ncbi:hypothetical protein NV104_002629 [Vibrio parahaemolyticus]|nr:hypothetical protein [Vibrio parahaemolyticus]EJS9799247.1 hypothetical protein [Vibrio parahaemolyticus]